MATTPPAPPAAHHEAFVVEVVSNHNSDSATRRKLIFEPEDPSAFASRAWEALHGAGDASPPAIVLAYEDGARKPDAKHASPSGHQPGTRTTRS
jgi:hypothetical protein